MRLHDLVETSLRVAETSARLEKIGYLADCLRRAGPEGVAPAVSMLAGELPLGRIGVGYATVQEAVPEGAADEPRLALGEVLDALRSVKETAGAGSTARRLELLRGLLARATRPEQRFLTRLLVGELRQGALEGLMAEAIASASGLAAPVVRRALMLEGDLASVARAALVEGEAGLARFSVQLFRPLKPMLANPADDVAEVLGRLGEAAFEHKLDGVRVQVHKSGDEVRVYSRRLNDLTHAVPEIVEAVAALSTRELILDGEALALRPGGRPHPFQVTMRRFGRKLDVAALRAELPLEAVFFDCLRVDADSLVDEPGEERFRALVDALPQRLLIQRLITDDADHAEQFLKSALEAGHEGLMAKSLQAPYAAGGRGRDWLKLKPAHTLDLVVLAAEWGSGRRSGWLSNLHLGARDPQSGAFVMLGKTFKGLTDATLAWQTERLKELETRREGHTVYVRPELVVEIAFNDVQTSPHYPAGMALRFARVKRYRPDKRAEDADTVEAVRAIHAAGA